MDQEQLSKRVDWLDEQRRKGSDKVAALEDRISELERALKKSEEQNKDLSSEVTRLSTVLARVDQFDASLGQHRLEVSAAIEGLEKARKEREQEIEAVHRVQLDGLNKHIAEIRNRIEAIGELQAGMEARKEEEMRLSRLIGEVQKGLLDVQRGEEERLRTTRLLEESSRRDNKRLIDLQGETLALRKRVDEHRGKLDLASDGLNKMEARVRELVTLESDRRERYTSFVEKQNLIQVERDHQWKEWQARFETIEKQAMELESHLQNLHTAQRDVRRAQAAVEEVTERVERRINEISEMQRLAEDRFRQEWVTFKADDQKRWTNYTLTQEEQANEAARLQGRLREQVTELEDRVQDLDDTTTQLEEQTEKRLQSLLAIVRDWVAEFERVFGRAV